MKEKLKFRGTSKQIGFQHGALLKEEIAAVLKTYLKMWNLSESKVPSAVKGFMTTIRSEFPRLSEEITGIAEGSQIPEEFIYAINARTELLENVLECTSVGVPDYAHKDGNTILAQNWDWYFPFRALTRTVDLQPNDKPRMMMLIEPGMVGKIGLNELGIGVCLNFLPTKNINHSGLPVHCILRTILESESYSAAENCVTEVPRAASANYVLGSSDGNVYNLETTPEDVVIILEAKPYVSHTNSFTARGDFCLRNELFNRSLSKSRSNSKEHKISNDDINRALDRVRFPRTLSLERSFYNRSETIHKININLSSRRLSVSEGDNNFTVYSFD